LNTFDWSGIGIEEVHGAYSAKEALALLHQFSIDIVITDIYMPGMSGIELIAEIRKRWRKTKCIVLSGYSDFEYAREAIAHQAESYLIKPVNANELLDTVQRVIDKIKQEWEEVVSRQKLEQALQDNLPLLRSALLNDILTGQAARTSTLEEKMRLLGLSEFFGKAAALMIIRLEEPFNDYDFKDLALIEYAVGNMAEELFEQHFHCWMTKDANDYRVIAVSVKTDMDERERQLLFERAASELQAAVGAYFRGKLSALVSGWGVFQHEVSSLYRSSISAFRLQVGHSKGVFMRIDDELVQLEVKSLQSLRNPPSLMQLLEMGRWDDAGRKLEEIFAELEAKWSSSQDHLLEVFYHLSATFTCTIHKNGYPLCRIFADDYDQLTKGFSFASIPQLRDWAMRVLGRLNVEVEAESVTKRKSIIKEICSIVENQLSEDVTLQRIAEQVFLHPSYISRIFKMETGENLSEYVHRTRMERAKFLLRSSPMKIYEIAAQLGYMRPHSFNFVFKKAYGMTPQKYRELNAR